MPLIIDAKLTFVSNRDSKIEYDVTLKQWTLSMEDSEMNTFGTSEASLVSFALGKHKWRIQNDSYECSNGSPYVIELKLTGCGEGKFTCNDGQCVTMEQRCDQLANCRDKSDERRCELVKSEEGYNRKVPPITSVSSTWRSEADDRVVPVPVNISITLMKVVEIEETDHSIHLQFQISLQWRENRVKYLNLKKDTSLNALTDGEIKELWLPLILYDNTDQKEVTRLGVEWEWMTFVTVTREGDFTRSGLEEVDEIEIFEGAENRLTMNQTYTWEFQCKYELQRYPFDTQVNIWLYHLFNSCVFNNRSVKSR